VGDRRGHEHKAWAIRGLRSADRSLATHGSRPLCFRLTLGLAARIANRLLQLHLRIGIGVISGRTPPRASVTMKLILASAVSRIHCRLRRARRDSGGDPPENCHELPSAATFATWVDGSQATEPPATGIPGATGCPQTPEPGDRYKFCYPSFPWPLEGGVPAGLRPMLRTVSGEKWRVGEIVPLAANQCQSQKMRKAVSPS
jgi:hypothetical protein